MATDVSGIAVCRFGLFVDQAGIHNVKHKKGHCLGCSSVSFLPKPPLDPHGANLNHHSPPTESDRGGLLVQIAALHTPITKVHAGLHSEFLCIARIHVKDPRIHVEIKEILAACWIHAGPMAA